MKSWGVFVVSTILSGFGFYLLNDLDIALTVFFGTWVILTLIRIEILMQEKGTQ